jgi:magnesium transporter
MMTTPIPWWISYPALLLGMAGLGVAMVLMLKRMARSTA